MFWWIAVKHGVSSEELARAHRHTELKTLHFCALLTQTATGCSEINKEFCYEYIYTAAPCHMYLTAPRMPSASFKRESCHSVRSHPLFSLPLEKLRGLSWSPWQQHDSDGSWELLYKLNCLEGKTTTTTTTKTQQPEILFYFIWHLSVMSLATLLMQTDVALDLYIFFLLFFFFWGCIILSLHIGCVTILQHVLFSQWPYSILFYA